MPFVAIKTEEQLDQQASHRMSDALGDAAYRCTNRSAVFLWNVVLNYGY